MHTVSARLQPTKSTGHLLKLFTEVSAIAVAIFLLSSCGLTFKLSTKVKVNDSLLESYLRVIKNLRLDANSELFAGAHDLGEGKNKVTVLVPGTNFEKLPLPEGVSTSIHLKNIDIDIHDDDEIDTAKSSGLFEVENVPNATVPIFVKTNLQYGALSIPLAIPISKVSWSKGGSVTVEPAITKIPVDTDGTGWSENDDRLPKGAKEVNSVCSSLTSLAANFAQHIGARLTDSIQKRDGLSALVALHNDRRSLLWKTITIERALFSIREKSELIVGASILHFPDENGPKSSLEMQHLKFDQNLDYDGAIHADLHLTNESKFVASDAATVCQSADIVLNSEFSRRGSELIVKMDKEAPNSISFNNCIQNIGLPAHTVTEIDEVKAKISGLLAKRDTEKHKSSLSTHIVVTLGAGMVNVSFRGGDFRSLLREPFTVQVQVDDSEDKKALTCDSDSGLKLKDVEIAYSKDADSANLQVLTLDTSTIHVKNSFNGMTISSEGVTFKALSAQMTNGKNSFLVKCDPTQSILTTTAPLNFDTTRDGSKQVPDFDLKFLSNHGLISSEKFNLTIKQLDGDLSYRPSTTTVVRAKMNLTAKGCPAEFEPILAANDIGLDCSELEFGMTNDGVAGKFKKVIISMPERQALALLKHYIPQRYEIPGGKMLVEKPPLHVWDIETRDGGWIDRISSSLKGRFMSDSTFYIQSWEPVVYLRTTCKYNHCRWFVCRVRNQNWDIDTSWNLNGSFKFNYLPGESLGKSEIEVKANYVNPVTFSVLKLEGMNNAVKIAIQALAATSFWLPIDDEVEKAIDTKKFPFIKGNKPESILNKFKVGNFSFGVQQNELQWTVDDLSFSIE